jgi:acyl-coenzyme A thioesterase PaaI-like protein
VSAQPVYTDCFVCGETNSIGLGLTFHSDGDHVSTEFTPDERHQGYPGLFHGGLLYTILDEVTGRAAYLRQAWVFSGKVEIRYHQPAYIGQKLLFNSEIVSERSRAFELKGEARRASDNQLVASMSGLFFRLSEQQRLEAETAVGMSQQTNAE